MKKMQKKKKKEKKINLFFNNIYQKNNYEWKNY